MLQTILTATKWISLPLLLIGSILARYAGSYEFMLNLAICLGAMVVVQRAVSGRKYAWGAGFVLIAIVFSPLALATKMFLLMGCSCTVAFAALVVAWKPQLVPAA